ncbi:MULTISPECIES: head-tail connector protein [unclassified Vibrio]|uniref:head-tail connector protein n=1 Tax=unclassified Vibrio TaxID=2614977 RepID=UPI000B8E99C6|nr:MULTISPECIES: head-tail connector protein [unclassified Vibrio]NAX17185.1 phage gp6-like head-tail connector protein [Vibrio sp. V22_P2S10T140]OXX39640.1 hypothetical protein B9J83_15070 [Vibrio sp. V07_P2A8T137]OXX58189.1 hypothetical protein B9J82_08870 [Vibrio sp. V10_P2A27P122]PSD42856.1 phage gp6-like head-tail connector protein [Vibrio sp. V02_P2A34T13]
MSIINLQTAKQYLNVIHDFDDDNLQMLLDAAESEAQEFLDQPLVNLLPEAEDPQVAAKLPGSLILAILMLMQGAYQASPDDAEKLREGAEIKMTPFRVGWGI